MYQSLHQALASGRAHSLSYWRSAFPVHLARPFELTTAIHSGRSNARHAPSHIYARAISTPTRGRIWTPQRRSSSVRQPSAAKHSGRRNTSRSTRKSTKASSPLPCVAHARPHIHELTMCSVRPTTAMSGSPSTTNYARTLRRNTVHRARNLFVASTKTATSPSRPLRS